MEKFQSKMQYFTKIHKNADKVQISFLDNLGVHKQEVYMDVLIKEKVRNIMTFITVAPSQIYNKKLSWLDEDKKN